ncbi:uncharacterized protein LOC100679639 isoform X2 [Nasonia vitripennis]|uniref:Uncharacterized protein n=1 Tax=Nasonia vitripennis TaxID=7425 RepID=A0A7M7H3V8_NASVI|nr:uncharacterized protein LOC100679639 isoform X2 [Nasonia vitripennis]
MASHFSIFSESENRNSLSLNKGKERSQNLKLAKLKTVGTTGSTPLKIFAQPQPTKPKGLSIRSKSDLNVSVSTSSGFSKQISKDCMNLEDKSNVSKKPSLSPIKWKTPKNVVDEFVFAKPATPKPLKKYPEPETLAGYYDPIKLMDEEMESIFNKDLASIKLVRSNDDSINSLEDEGFISDPEQDSLYDSLMQCSIPSYDDIGLPDISDSDGED